jgi:hypothetical protein
MNSSPATSLSSPIDPMELVHSHLAKHPPALQEFKIQNSKFPRLSLTLWPS